jgi:cytoplasmic FMR1 interacting protein
MAYSNPKNALGELSAVMEVEGGHSMKSLESVANAYSSHAFIHSQTILPPISSYEKECTVRDVNCYLDSKGAQASVLAEDFEQLTNLKKVSSDADSFISFLYSHRALAPCLPQITESRKDQTESIYGAWIAILQPFADKLTDLYTFTRSAVDIVKDEMTFFLQQRESNVSYSSERLWNLAVVIDRLYLIDSLKSVKASINNDFSAFKRASLSRAALGVSAADRLEQAQLHMDLGQYLANKGSVLKLLKEKVFLVRHGSQSFVHVIAELLRYTVPALAATVAGGSADGAECHLLPAERHSLLRVVPICMVLLGPEEKDVRDILQDKGSLGKELQLQKLLREAVDLLKSNPVGPLYADMPVVVHSVLLEAAWFPKLADTFFSGLVNPSEMTDAEASAVNQRYDLREHLQRLRRQYAMTLSRFHCMSLALQASQADTGEAWRPEILQEGYSATLDVLKTLAAMCALTIEQAAWKCCRPAKSGGTPGIEKDLDEELICRYDRMVKFNYHPTELDAILEVLVMSLNLGHCLKSKRTTIMSLVKRYMHGDTQSMMQERLTGMFTHAAKNKKREMLDMLTILRKVHAARTSRFFGELG